MPCTANVVRLPPELSSDDVAVDPDSTPELSDPTPACSPPALIAAMPSSPPMLWVVKCWANPTSLVSAPPSPSSGPPSADA